MLSPGGQLRRLVWHFRRGGIPQVLEWRRRLSAEAGTRSGRSENRWLSRTKIRSRRSSLFLPTPLPEVKPRRNDIRAGVILDEFSTMAFAPEWNQLVLSKETWDEQLRSNSVDLIFVESAWAGNGGEWQYQLTGTSGPKDELRRLLAFCRDAGIPTVFWNKEDPAHYVEFLDAARLFDYVLTTDEDRIRDYRRDLGHNRISTLTFAAQPAIHNPIRSIAQAKTRDIAFAGMYFRHKYPERATQMDILLGAALDVSPRMEFGLEIFSRQFGADERYQFRPPFASRVVGHLSYREMLSAYKAYRVFLNVNSVVDSPTMCARRVFEITAAGTPVVSTPSLALRNIFSRDEICLVDNREMAGQILRALVRSPELRDRSVHKAQRKIWSAHTYAHRVESILSSVIPERSKAHDVPTVSMCVSSNRPKQLRHIFETASRQVGIDVELVLLTHGYTPSKSELMSLKAEFSLANVSHLQAEGSLSLGACLNRCFEASTGDIAAKMDDDDFYGSHYLQDQVASLKFSGATVVGKQCHYMYFASNDATILRFADKEHVFTRMVMGPTLVARRETFIQHPFDPVDRGEDTAFLRSVADDGGTIYSADRFNYWQLRSGGLHTWQATDEELLASGAVQFFGNPTAHVAV